MTCLVHGPPTLKAYTHVVFDRLPHSIFDGQGSSIPIYYHQYRAYNDEVAEYDRLDNIDYSNYWSALY